MPSRAEPPMTSRETLPDAADLPVRAGTGGPIAVVLAAGQGTRMRSDVPKLLHPLCGRPMVAWPVAAARAAGAERIVVVDGPERRLELSLHGDVAIAVQEQPLGTADAVRAASAHIGPADTVVVINA